MVSDAQSRPLKELAREIFLATLAEVDVAVERSLAEMEVVVAHRARAH